MPRAALRPNSSKAPQCKSVDPPPPDPAKIENGRMLAPGHTRHLRGDGGGYRRPPTTRVCPPPKLPTPPRDKHQTRGLAGKIRRAHLYGEDRNSPINPGKIARLGDRAIRTRTNVENTHVDDTQRPTSMVHTRQTRRPSAFWGNRALGAEHLHRQKTLKKRGGKRYGAP